MNNGKSMQLVLEDGSVYAGISFGFDRSISGEVVFNTAMTGYPESLTDPSYKGQILVLTYPLIGNYGVPDDQVEDQLLRHFESDRLHISGLVVSDYSEEYSHWNAKRSLGDWLKQYRVPGVYGMDTRLLTKKLRKKGTMLGKMMNDSRDIDFYDPNRDNLVAQVSIPEKVVYGTGRYRILLIDCGVKFSIIRYLLERDTTVIRVPWNYDFSRESYDGLFISNGPGDPKQCEETIENISRMYLQDIPIMGICLGNQLMALASGADTYKLKYGHRSHNQPVIQAGTDKAFITSQNHGYAVDHDSLKKEWKPYFINLNDQTNEGLIHTSKPFFSSQFHPEASGGPMDTDFLFDKFVNLIKKNLGEE